MKKNNSFIEALGLVVISGIFAAIFIFMTK